MNIEVSTAAAAEGTALPAPRAFGEANTLTLPRGRRRADRRGMTARLIEPDSVSERVAVMTVVPADATPITVTF